MCVCVCVHGLKVLLRYATSQIQLVVSTKQALHQLQTETTAQVENDNTSESQAGVGHSHRYGAVRQIWNREVCLTGRQVYGADRQAANHADWTKNTSFH